MEEPGIVWTAGNSLLYSVVWYEFEKWFSVMSILLFRYTLWYSRHTASCIVKNMSLSIMSMVILSLFGECPV